MMNSAVLKQDGMTVVTVIVNGQSETATDQHPNFAAIMEKVNNNDEDGILDLFDLSVAVAQRFNKVSERVSLASGNVFFDGDLVDDALTKQIVAFYEQGHDFMPLVNFMEKIAQNPLEHSRNNLYRFIKRNDITIDEDGNMILYKGVQAGPDGIYTSQTSGPAIVDGRSVNGLVPQPIGGVIDMARSQVQHDPRVGCDVGPHCGAHSYAQWFARDAVLKVRVSPRDVVSVPEDENERKVRVCRYVVLDVTPKSKSQEMTSAYYEPSYGEPDDAYYDYENEDEEEEGFVEIEFEPSSSWVDSVYWCSDNYEMHVAVANGGVYVHENVDGETVRAFQNADSAGKWYNEFIRSLR